MGKKKNEFHINDGAYENAVTGIGSAVYDKVEHNRVSQLKLLSYDEIGRIYVSDGIGARIIKAVADQAIMHGFDFDGDDDYSKHLLFDSIISNKFLIEMSRAVRRTGGALVYMQIADGGKIEAAPTNGKIVGVKLFSAGVVKDIIYDNDGELLEFCIFNGDGRQININAKRCIVVKGEAIPDEINFTFDKIHRFFGIGALDSIYKKLSNYDISISEVCNLLSESNITVTSIKGLNSILSQQSGSNGLNAGLNALIARFRASKLSKSMLKTVIQDADDTTTIKSNSFAGISDSVKTIQMAISASCGLSMSKIFGEASSGLSATGEGDRNNDNDLVRMWQQLVLNDTIINLYEQISLRNKGISERPSITFAPIDSPTKSELADIRLKQVQAIRQLWEMECVTSEEVRELISNGFPDDINFNLGN